MSWYPNYLIKFLQSVVKMPYSRKGFILALLTFFQARILEWVAILNLPVMQEPQETQV